MPLPVVLRGLACACVRMCVHVSVCECVSVCVGVNVCDTVVWWARLPSFSQPWSECMRTWQSCVQTPVRRSGPSPTRKTWVLLPPRARLQEGVCVVVTLVVCRVSQSVLALTPTLIPDLMFHDLVFGRDLGSGSFSCVKYAKRIVRGTSASMWPEYAVKVISTEMIRRLGEQLSVCPPPPQYNALPWPLPCCARLHCCRHLPINAYNTTAAPRHRAVGLDINPPCVVAVCRFVDPQGTSPVCSESWPCFGCCPIPDWRGWLLPSAGERARTSCWSLLLEATYTPRFAAPNKPGAEHVTWACVALVRRVCVSPPISL